MFGEDPVQVLLKLGHCFRPVLDASIIKPIGFHRVSIATNCTFNVKRCVVSPGNVQLPFAAATTSVFKFYKHVCTPDPKKEHNRLSGLWQNRQCVSRLPALLRTRNQIVAFLESKPRQKR